MDATGIVAADGEWPALFQTVKSAVQDQIEQAEAVIASWLSPAFDGSARSK